MDFEKIYQECKEKSVLKEERLREMGFVSVRKAVLRLKISVQNLISSYSSKGKSLENYDIIARLAVEDLIDKGSGSSIKDKNYRKDYDPNLSPFIPILSDKNKQKIDKVTWINKVISLLNDISKEIVDRIKYWLIKLIP
jgi:hypothetical protein